MGIENIQGVRTDISEMLNKLREVSDKSKFFATEIAASESKSFGDVLSGIGSAANRVNDLQATTETLKAAFASGDSNVSMSQVIVASQKSRLAFEGLMAVRNKILEAYKEIMNMPI